MLICCSLFEPSMNISKEKTSTKYFSSPQQYFFCFFLQNYRNVKNIYCAKIKQELVKYKNNIKTWNKYKIIRNVELLEKYQE